jgi:hypothetical protein
MAYIPRSSSFELNRLHNPWVKFSRRDETQHVLDSEVKYRLGRLSIQPPPTPPTAITQNSATKTTTEVVRLFMNHGKFRLDEVVLRQQQLVKDFLKAASPPASGSGPTSTYIDDVRLSSSVSDIALIDDRNYHEGCVKKFGKPCTECHIFSGKVTIPELCTRLESQVSPVIHMDRAIQPINRAPSYSATTHKAALIGG